ncbi:MAG: hypothetical protein ACLFUN_04795 [Desulfobacterales bacterium]
MMQNSMPPTMEELRRRRQRALEKAEKAISERPGEYREIKRLLDEILDRPVDVTDYYRVAGEIVRLLEKLSASSSESLFAYYCSNIDPRKKGDARYFKVVCRDLRHQLNLVDQYRRQRHNLRILG